MNNNLSALDIYFNRVFKSLMIILPCIALSAGLTLSVIKFLGYYDSVSNLKLILFDLSTVLYLIIGLRFARRCTDKQGFVRPSVLRRGKVFIILIEFLQWNFIAFMVPSRDYWAYAVFFILLSVIFMDSKFTAIIIGVIISSVAINWVIRPDELLPVKDDLYVPDMILRGVLLVLSSFFLWLITYILETRLVGELEKIAAVDSLTLLPNRRSLYCNFETNMKEKKSIYGMMCDIDDFKRVNDTFGHDCGDEVLKNVAAIMVDCLGDNGVAYRYGGEEFVCLIFLEEEGARELSEKIRTGIQNSSLNYGGDVISVTITAGLQKCENGMGVETVIKGADEKLYSGKNNGKNQVVM